jgi:tRNA-2-methylthio-N6-dimethylallyladenosine synthase
MRDCERICRYLHVPAQSGSDHILKLMNRGYTSGEYMDLVDRARALMPDVSIASDFIVGFPTETDEDLQQTINLVERCRFKNSFIFKYSPRPGTVAIERFEDDVPKDVKRRRNNELLALQSRICAENNRQMIGKTVEVIVEGESKLVSRQAARAPSAVSNVILGWEQHKHPSDDSSNLHGRGIRTQLVGRTRGDQVVCFDGSPTLKGKILRVTITDAQNLTLFGRLMASTTPTALSLHGAAGQA